MDSENGSPDEWGSRCRGPNGKFAPKEACHDGVYTGPRAKDSRRKRPKRT